MQEKIVLPGVFSFVVHGLLFFFLTLGVQWQLPKERTMNVALVRSLPVEESAIEMPPPAKEAPPKAKPVPLPPPPAKADIALSQKKSAPLEKMDKPALPSPKVSAKTKPATANLADEQLKAELKKETTALATQRQQQQLLQDENAASAVLADMQQSNRLRQARDAYINQIRLKIRRNITRPPGATGNPEATFEVSQLPSGEIFRVQLTRSTGNVLLDKAIEKAIWKSSPLPQPELPELFDRRLNLTVRPLDE